MMSRHRGLVIPWLAVALSLMVTVGASAQTVHITGQTIQPAYEGWSKNPDGTISFWFGYLNRNYEEAPEVPIGPNNSFSPGPADRGQPTFFYPRRQMFVFKVDVPGDWGKKELVWTVNHNGKAYTATALTLESWIVDEGVMQANRGSGLRQWTQQERKAMAEGKMKRNQPPAINIVGSKALTTSVSAPVTLTVEAKDDGMPGPRAQVRSPSERLTGVDDARRRNPPPPLRESEPRDGPGGGYVVPGIPVFGPGPQQQDMVKGRVAFETGLGVSWILYRGPGKVAFKPQSSPVKGGGPVSTAATFSTPGTYVIRAYADDSTFTTPTEFTVTVK